MLPPFRGIRVHDASVDCSPRSSEITFELSSVQSLNSAQLPVFNLCFLLKTNKKLQLVIFKSFLLKIESNHLDELSDQILSFPGIEAVTAGTDFVTRCRKARARSRHPATLEFFCAQFCSPSYGRSVVTKNPYCFIF